MPFHHHNPEREGNAYALPNVETFYHTESDGPDCWYSPGIWDDCDPDACAPAGWYYWFCFPGCMPDSDPRGPYQTEQEAIEAARDE